LLIAHGADVNAQGKHGHTALDYAAQKKYDDVAGMLRQHGAK
jgi:ankyrin repeat protein